MYITCDQCSTVYRLDEKLLKRTGSKVRCSQCSYIFIAEPPEVSLAEADQPDSASESADERQDTFDQELEGIDVAELDSILEQGRSTGADAALPGGMDNDLDEEPIEFNEADLDMDFDAAFDQEENISEADDTVVESSDPTTEPQLEDLSDEIDLDMDFELDDDAVFDQPLLSEDDDLNIDLNMDFDLDDTSQQGDAIASADESIAAESDLASDEKEITDSSDVLLDEDVDLALDDFEEVLGGAVGTEDEDLLDVEAEDIDADIEIADAPAASDSSDVEDIMHEVDASEAQLGLSDEQAASSPKAESDDLGLSGLGSFLDEEDDDEPAGASELEEIELSLDDDFKLDLEQEAEEEPPLEEALEASGTTAAEPLKDDIDDVDLAGLDDLLGVDDELDSSTVSSGADIELDEDIELTLDNAAALEDALDKSEAATVAAENAKDEELDMADLEGFSDEDETPAEASADEDQQLSLVDDLALSLDEEAVPGDAPADETGAMALAGDTQGDDIDLSGLDDFLDEDETPVEASADEDQELSLVDEELDLSMDEESASEPSQATPAQTDQVDRDEFDLSDFEDLLLDEEAAPQQAAAEEQDGQAASLDLQHEPQKAVKETDDFDMSDIDDLLEEDPAADQSQEEEDLELKLDDELELSLDNDVDLELDSDDTEALVTPEEDGDELDLAGMDDMLLEEDIPDSSKEADSELELSLDDDEIEFSLDEDAVKTIEEDTGELEELDLELDAEFEEKAAALEEEVSEIELKDEASASDALDESLDLSDIEKMLEEDTIVPETSGATQGLRDADLGDADEADDLGLDGDEIDLADIEEAIDSDDEVDSDASFMDGVKDPELELDLDFEPVESKEADTIDDFELELEMEDSPALAADQKEDESDILDLSGLDLATEKGDKNVLKTETVDGGDIQLEFQIEETGYELDTEEGAAAAKTTAGAATTGFMQMEEEEDFSGEETIATEPMGGPSAPGVATAPKPKGKSKVLLFLIPILLLLVAGGYFGYVYVQKNNIQIPFLSNYINPGAKDPSGIQQLVTMEISSKFIENATEGRLFVITGKVRNGYSKSRKMIRLRGKLYTKGKVLARTEQATAGLVLTDQDLSSKPMAEIKKGLTAIADQDTAVTVAAGNSVPFMVVFSNLPSDLDEFVIELVSSDTAQ
jgi:predicted Zn finger-like uncharacterized protein